MSNSKKKETAFSRSTASKSSTTSSSQLRY